MDARPDDAAFLDIIRHTPLVSIDLIIRNAQDQILLGLRRNRPAQGYWFVPGGRIHKDETLAQAQARISRVETGAELTGGQLIGVFEHLYEDNTFEAPGVGTHYVTMGVLLDWPASRAPSGDDQHQGFRWASVAELLADEQVHPNTRRFFQAGTPAAFQGPAAQVFGGCS